MPRLALTVAALSVATLAPAAPVNAETVDTTAPVIGGFTKTVETGTSTPRAVVLAARAERWLDKRVKRQMKARGWAYSNTWAPRYKRMPERLTAAMDPSRLRVNRWGHVRRYQTFSTGSAATAVCLNLDTGRIARVACGTKRTPADESLVGAYKRLVESMMWLDEHRSVYGYTLGEVRTVRNVARRELPPGWLVRYSDDDRDGRVDNGLVWLVRADGSECGQVSLPKRNNAGGYSASMVHC